MANESKPRHKFVAWCSVGLVRGGGYVDRCAHCGLYRRTGRIERGSINYNTGVGTFSSREVPFYSFDRERWSPDKLTCTGKSVEEASRVG